MKFTEQAIQERALEIYQAAIKNPRISEDICSDLYYAFIERMTNYGAKHPDEEAGPGLVKSVVRSLIRDLERIERRQEYHDEVITTTEECSYYDYLEVDEIDYQKDILEKLSEFIKLMLYRRKSFYEYTVFFLLYYCVYLPSNFILAQFNQFQLLAQKNSQELEELVLFLRQQAMDYGKLTRQKKEHSVFNAFKCIINYHWKMHRENASGNTFIPGDDYDKLLKRRDRSLDNNAAFIIAPHYTVIGDVLGFSDDKVGYGVLAFNKAFKHFYETGELPVYKTKTLKSA